MKLLSLLLITFALTGCAYLGPKDYNNYVESAKSISKDNTMAQTACWSAITEIAKGGDQSAKVNAIALAEKCKTETIKLESPKKNWLGF
jgi:hypothetical protein